MAGLYCSIHHFSPQIRNLSRDIIDYFMVGQCCHLILYKVVHICIPTENYVLNDLAPMV